ncbi:MAG: adenylate cyclase, partial [Nitrospinaceae bacterium]|nr:adenylate cyclase [Nitrospinaceae bacterium]NIR55916.1 adenylate cyclase [Nitrospinaceae bacterium]NIS86363.1 adenylate cyclase [Nitrospinaceae bacterium]NIT83199.1 adenylate cyclase [Nitrospinaceae bacterium]NIU45410.1 adenylate cyclase [Nitrospinaceae bacterium]
EKSDLDFTLLVDNESFTEESLALFRRKLRLIEEWAWNEFHMETHFFINDWREVRNNMFGESDSESTGSALAKLLKEEMFRTLIILAGKIPFWWITPVETDDARYDTLLQRVHSGQTLLNREEFIDIGNVDDISNGEFFGGSIWTLIKSFQSPFKTIMKMGLLEDYMFGETRFNLLCHGIKKKVFSDKTFSDIDPYFSLFERVQEFFQQTKSENDLDTLRAAFYLKVGTQVTPQELEAGSQDYKKSILIHLIRSWGWNAYKLKQLNQYTDWQMMQKVAMGNRVNKILMSSYKNISEKNKSLDSQESLITQKDTHLLGRKLFSFYRRAPNKVENLFALADGNTAERELTFLLEQEKPRERPTWYLIRGRTLTFIEHVNPENIIKKAATLPFLIAFTAFNKLFRSETELLIRAEGQSCKESDLRILLNQLTSFISQINIATISNEDLLCEARINKLYLIIDFGNPIPREIVYGNINDCKSNEELTQFINKRVERIKNLTAIYLTSWGEL